MPKTDVVYYAETDGTAPVLQWLDDVPDHAKHKLFYRIRRLEQAGHELHRPEADYLRDGIYELRVRSQRVNYRLLYFFHGRVAVVAHGCTKEGPVEQADIRRAVNRRTAYVQNSAAHTYGLPG